MIAIALGVGTWLVWAHELKVGVDPSVIRINSLGDLIPLAIVAILLASRTPLRIALPLVLILLLGQRIIVDGSIYPSLPQHDFYPKIPIIRAIPENTGEPFRVAGEHFVLIPDSAAIYQLEDPRGYEAMTFARLADTYPVWSIPQPVSFNAIGDLQPPFLSFLNIKYAIVPISVDLTPGWRELMKDRSAKLFENTHVLPRAFVPRRIRYERDGVLVLKGMKTAKDFSDMAWIEVPEDKPHEIANGPGTLTIRRDGFGLDIDADDGRRRLGGGLAVGVERMARLHRRPPRPDAFRQSRLPRRLRSRRTPSRQTAISPGVVHAGTGDFVCDTGLLFSGGARLRKT